MAIHQGSKRSSFVVYFIFVVVLVVIIVSSFHNTSYSALPQEHTKSQHINRHKQSSALDKTVLTGHAIAPKLGNETAKAELGRAAWKLFHTTFARFPDKPTQDERLALKSYIHLFQRLYPCGECASHFGVILEKYPPQVSTRSAAAAWGCHVHNEVNKSLDKELFDCSQIGDFYDCGCADGDEKDGTSGETSKSKSQAHRMALPSVDDDDPPLQLEREEYQKGG